MLDLEGFTEVCDCIGVACDDAGNACGVHIHFGTDCNDAENI